MGREIIYPKQKGLKVARAKNDLDQLGLALRIGRSASLVGFYEQGRAYPTDDNKRRIEVILGDVEWKSM